MKELLEKRNKVDYNCQLALNCIYEIQPNQPLVLNNQKFKTSSSSVRKERQKNSRSRDNASKAKIHKFSDVSNKYKKFKTGISRDNQKETANNAAVQHSSVNRSASKVSNRGIRKKSKLKIKKTGNIFIPNSCFSGYNLKILI